MRGRHVISFDVHCEETEIVVSKESGDIVHRCRRPTTVPELLETIDSVPRPRHLVLEEGPLADWLYRNLVSHVDKMVVCDPRRNHLIAKDSDKDDPIDAEKLGQLYRGGYVKAVHHTEALEQSIFKQHVGLYHDLVRGRVRQANRVMAQFRRHGVLVRERGFADAKLRPVLLKKLPDHEMLRAAMNCLWKEYDVAAEQVVEMRRMLVRRARNEPQIVRFTTIPGVKWIRATTIFVYLDTPWRFRSKSALWKYLGVGLERRRSGNGPTLLRLGWYVNRTLKSAILGAAKSAIVAGDNPFAEQYKRWLNGGLTPRMARRNVARSQAAVMWGMWKTGGVYCPERVGVSTTANPRDVLCAVKCVLLGWSTDSSL